MCVWGSITSPGLLSQILFALRPLNWTFIEGSFRSQGFETQDLPRGATRETLYETKGKLMDNIDIVHNKSPLYWV